MPYILGLELMTILKTEMEEQVMLSYEDAGNNQ
jgi:hypothetical protein